MTEFDVDPALKVEYIDESLEGLEGLSEQLVALESAPGELEIIQSVFRPVHSIKGNAAYFNLLQVKNLAHELETLLDLLRKEKLVATGNVINVLLEGIDALISMLERSRNAEPEVADEAAFTALVDKVCSAAKGEQEQVSELWKRLLGSLDDWSQDPAALKELLEKLAGTTVEGQAALSERDGAPPKGGEEPSAAAELRGLLDTQIETHLDDASAQRVGVLLQEVMDSLQDNQHKAELREVQEEYELFVDTVGVEPVLQASILEKIESLAQKGAWAVAEKKPAEEETRVPDQEEAVAKEEKPAEAAKEGKGSDAGKTMRVTESSIDAFLAHVGDLVVIGEMYEHFQNRLSETDAALGREMFRINESFRDLSDSLQQSIMHIRKVPLRSVFQRMPRIVRDVAKANGKEIEAYVEGEDILVDKSILDALEAPLMHMTRNSADHGVEAPEEREAAGKPRKGRVDILAEESAESVFIKVIDDGKGLDLEALQAKAASIGLIAADQELAEQDIINLLFSSGVSTAKAITDISGRGVGMDVARRNVESLGGSIAVQTQQGQGSAFTLQLPKSVSTQIITGFSVIVEKRRYVLPLDRIHRCFRPAPEQIVSVQGKGKCVKDGDQVIIMSRFQNLCNGVWYDNADYTTGILVVVETKGGEHALHVDEIEGVKQVVLKEVDDFLNTEGIFLGGAIMGDGTVAMVIDIDQFVGLALEKQAPPA